MTVKREMKTVKKEVITVEIEVVNDCEGVRTI